MKQFFNIYLVLDKDHNMRMFRENIGEVNVYEPLYYSLNYQTAVNKFMQYKEEHEGEFVIVLVENEIPVQGTVYNFVPRDDYVDEKIY